MRPRIWVGHLTIAPGWALLVGRPGDNARHSHQAVQICVSGAKPLSVAVLERPAARVNAIAIGPNVRHRVEVNQGSAALLYLDPNGREGRRVAEAIGSPGWCTAATDQWEGRSQAIREFAQAEWSADRVHAIRDGILRLWLRRAGDHSSESDPRVEASIRLIRVAITQGGVRVAELARGVGLSPSRLSALFRRHTGAAIRPFVLWTRLQRAIETVGAGGTLTEAAHAAGFADSAHLSRTFRRMFGTTLSAGVRRLRIRILP